MHKLPLRELGNFHTLKLIGIFAEVHAFVKNDFDFICRWGGKLCEAFLETAVPEAVTPSGTFSCNYAQCMVYW